MILDGLKHSYVTHLETGLINNADAALLVLLEAGGVAATTDVRAALRTWRPGLHFTYLFHSHDPSGGYGFTGTSFESINNRVYHYHDFNSSKDGHYSTRRTYWYRRSRGVVALTAEGIRRLREMGYTAS